MRQRPNNLQNRNTSNNTQTDSSQSETAETNETTKEKFTGAIEGLRDGIDGFGITILKWLVFAVIVYIPTAAVFDPLPLPQFTDVQAVFVVVFILALLLLYLPTAKFIDRIYSPKKEAIIEIDGSSDTVYDGWFGSPDLMEDVEVTDGVMRSKVIHGMVVHLVNDFDPESMKAKAPREMEIEDWEMWGEKEAIERQRHRNNALVEFGKQLYIRLPSMGQMIESNYWNKMSQKQVEKELTEPESFLNAVEEELPEVNDVTEDMRAAVNDSRVQSSKAGDTDE